MRTNITAAFRTFILNRICKTFARCWLVSTNYGDTFGYTSHTRDLVIDGITYYSATGLLATDLRSSEDLIVDNINLSAFLTDADEELIAAGRFDNARVEVFIVNYLDLSMEKLVHKVGYVGEVSRKDGQFSAELRGLTQILDTKIGEIYQASCRANLGDDRCKVRINPVIHFLQCDVDGTAESITMTVPAGNFIEDGYEIGGTLVITGSGAGNNITTTITNVTDDTILVAGNLTNESAVSLLLTQTNEFYLAGSVISVQISREAFTIDSTPVNFWYNQGVIEFTTGDNTGYRRDIRTQFGAEIRTYLPFPYAIQAGDDFFMTAGCDRTFTTCKNKFDNVVNFRGFPHVPTSEDVFNSPQQTGTPAA